MKIIINTALILFISTTLLSCIDRDLELKSYKNQIFSLKTNDQISGGGFVLGYVGGANINSSTNYVFFIKDKKTGGFVRKTIPSSSTILVEKDTIPSFKQYYWEEKRKINKGFWGLDEETEKTDWQLGLFNEKNTPDYEYILTIPKGTITENISYNPL